MPFFICPRCKSRRVDHDGREGFTLQPPSCRSCGFAFMFELLDDYYPAQATGFVVCDRDARILATGEGVFELTGYREADLMGRDLVEALGLSDPDPVETVREWGVRQLERELTLRTNTGLEKPVLADLFPAYDDDGGLLVALTPR
ncbi:MAG TPA: PAS domain-containing protein [Gaiellaceae bacterium]|nr:PAS domain-containing protein [Gaiellaceae bacterium]